MCLRLGSLIKVPCLTSRFMHSRVMRPWTSSDNPTLSELPMIGAQADLKDHTTFRCFKGFGLRRTSLSPCVF